MKLAQVVNDELTFKSRISRMGNNRIIWIPSALHEMIKDFEKGDVMVSIKNLKNVDER
ncbi:hypothetical protein BH18THE1_BH18THE1_21470 [soil metagenome]